MVSIFRHIRLGFSFCFTFLKKILLSLNQPFKELIECLQFFHHWFLSLGICDYFKAIVINKYLLRSDVTIRRKSIGTMTCRYKQTAIATNVFCVRAKLSNETHLHFNCGLGYLKCARAIHVSREVYRTFKRPKRAKWSAHSALYEVTLPSLPFASSLRTRVPIVIFS